jgi:hypothetical protein
LVVTGRRSEEVTGMGKDVVDGESGERVRVGKGESGSVIVHVGG